jgi:hypothetical protein
VLTSFELTSGKKAANGGEREFPLNDDGWTTYTLGRYSLIELHFTYDLILQDGTMASFNSISG